ncbi:MAG: metal ABC transporter substrate-binding protein [Anaerolineales bacterium]
MIFIFIIILITVAMLNRWVFYFLLFIASTALLTACSQPSPKAVLGEIDDGSLKLVATTTIVGDVVHNIAGETAEVVVLLPPGSDPHGFEPTPQDIALVSEADLVFANGAGLEEFLDPLIESAEAQDKIIYVSEGINLIKSNDSEENEGGDPHTWTDPNNVLLWANNIEQTLSKAAPDNAQMYQINAEEYRQKLTTLDQWVQEQVAQVSEDDRRLVTDHQVFAYFSDEYGFTQVGTLIPGYSSMAEPSAQGLAEIEDAIKALGVKAVFVGNTVNPNLAQRVAEDTGTELVFVYTGSLGEEAESYLEYIRYNVEAIVEALK